MIEIYGEATTLAIIGLFGGLLLGLAARFGRFCTLGALEDLLYGGSDKRMRMWGLSIGLSIIGVFGLAELGLFRPESSAYLSTQFNVIASIIGGLMFGYGMALCGNCGYGALARLGGGDLRSFVIVLVMGVSAYAVMSGPLAPLRVFLFPQDVPSEAPNGVAHILAYVIPLSANSIGLVIGAILIIMMCADTEFRKDPKAIIWSAIVAAAIISGWLGTYWVAETGFEARAIESHTFSAPVGDTLIYTMIGSAMTLSFAIGSVVGVLTGAFIGSLIKGHFRWEACEDPRELRRQIIGASVMGIGAVIAMGCSVGQGISAFSTLAYSAPVTFLAIFAGAWFGLKQLIEGFQPS